MAGKLALKGEYDIPCYALCYLFYGDQDGLTDEDISIIDKFMEKEDLSGCAKTTKDDSYNEFNSHPAFGLACNTITVQFYKYRR